MKDRPQSDYLYDILESAHKIKKYSAGLTYEKLLGSDVIQDAVAKRIEVIGETCKHIDEATMAALPAVPFQAMRGMRNRLAHDYTNVDLTYVWTVMTAKIGPLIEAIETYFQQQRLEVLIATARAQGL